jgi:hypothetical protein
MRIEEPECANTTPASEEVFAAIVADIAVCRSRQNRISRNLRRDTKVDLTGDRLPVSVDMLV